MRGRKLHNVKKLLKILLFIAVWAAVTWALRDRLLPVPKTDKGPLTHVRHARTSVRMATAEDDLTDVKGIGPAYNDRLEKLGITTFDALVDSDSEQVAEALEVSADAVDSWKTQAAGLTS